MRTLIWTMRLAAAYLAYLTLSLEAAPMLARLLLLIPAAFLGGVSQWLEHRRRVWLTAYRDAQAQELLESLLTDAPPDEPIFLYLRPFTSTGKLAIENPKVFGSNAAMPGSYEPAMIEAESVLRDALDRFGTLIALGRPGEHYGAGRVATEEAEWQARFGLLVERASLIFLLPSAAPGTSWEIQQLQERGYLGKTVIVMPPASRQRGFSAADEWASARAKVGELGLELPEHQQQGALFPSSGLGGLTLTNWMRLKEGRLRNGLQDLALQLGVNLAPRPAAERRTDAPLAPALSWMVVFWFMTFNGWLGWPTWHSGDEFNPGSGQAVATWALSAIGIGLLLFLLLESSYGRLGRAAFILLGAVAAVSASPYLFFPSFHFLYLGLPWVSLPMLIKGGLVGALLGALLRELVPGRFKVSRVVLLTVGCLLTAQLLVTLGHRTIQSFMQTGIIPPADLLAGILFGLGLPRAMNWDAWKPRPGAGASLGVDGFVIGWALVGYGLSQIDWSGQGRASMFWLLLGLAGGVAQCFGWSRQGRRLGFARSFAFVIAWSSAAGLAIVLTNWLWSWLDPSLSTSWYREESLFFRATRQGLNGLLFGVAGGILGVRLGKGVADSPESAARQGVFLGLGFGAIGFLGNYSWNGGFYGYHVPAQTLVMLLVALMGTAGYLDVRGRGWKELNRRRQPALEMTPQSP
ncbi:MAG TPA: hypothetical protein VE974_10645 [Thermoanaerobaculia bacterium]|nr:hypothetical protein [Thermoanaerobaculia bacterium]